MGYGGEEMDFSDPNIDIMAGINVDEFLGNIIAGQSQPTQNSPANF